MPYHGLDFLFLQLEMCCRYVFKSAIEYTLMQPEMSSATRAQSEQAKSIQVLASQGRVKSNHIKPKQNTQHQVKSNQIAAKSNPKASASKLN